MFLIERLIGISIYMYFLLVICLLIGFTNIKYKTAFKIYLLILCIMAFFYKPYITGDLYRIFNTIEIYSTMDFKTFFYELVVTSAIPVSRLLYWIVGKLSISKLLPVISAFISYYLIFYIIQDVQKKYNISRQNVSLTLFFIMATSIYISVVGGIRMMISMTLIIFCFYRESVDKKNSIINILLYMIALLMHEMTIVIVGIRIFSILFDKNIKKSTRSILFIFICLIFFVLIFNHDLLIYKFVDNFKNYVFGDSYLDLWEYLMGILIFLCIFLIYYVFFKKGYHIKYKELYAFNIGSLLGIFIAILFCYVFTIFYRFIGHFVPLMSIPTIMVTLEETSKKKCFTVSLKIIFIILVCLITIISFTRGSLSSLKFFVL